MVELGADISLLTGESLARDLQSIGFQNFLFDEDYLEVGCGEVDAFLEDHQSLFENNSENFYLELANHFWDYREDTLPEEIYLGQIYYK